MLQINKRQTTQIAASTFPEAEFSSQKSIRLFQIISGVAQCSVD